MNITKIISDGFNQLKSPTRTILGNLDIKQAFDTVSNHLLVEKIYKTNIHPIYKRWLKNFLRGRRGKVSLRDVKSASRAFKNGVPQGAVLSPLLFNLFLSDLPTPSSPFLNIISYADDIYPLSSHTSLSTASHLLQNYINSIALWANENLLDLSG